MCVCTVYIICIYKYKQRDLYILFWMQLIVMNRFDSTRFITKQNSNINKFSCALTSERCSASFRPQFLAFSSVESKSFPWPTCKIKDMESADRRNKSSIIWTHCWVSTEVKSDYNSITGKQEVLCQLHCLHGNHRTMSAVHGYEKPVQTFKNTAGDHKRNRLLPRINRPT